MTDIATPLVTSPEIRLREIDLDHLENVEDNREAVEFSVILSEAPSEAWVQEFTQLYKQIPYVLKPPVRPAKDRLYIIYLPRYASELPGFFRFLALIIHRANDETRRTEEIHTSNIQEKRKAEFREALRRIELPTSV